MDKMKNITKTYDSTISLMKGIAIISVLVGHASGELSFADKLVNQYHLATFFFIAGYFVKQRDIDYIFIYVWKKVKSLYIPFVLICSSVVCMLLIISEIIIGRGSLFLELKQKLACIIQGYWVSNMLESMWFVIYLFYASIMFILLKWIIKVCKLGDLFGILLLITLLLFDRYLLIGNGDLSSFTMTLFYTTFMFFGCSFRQIKTSYDILSGSRKTQCFRLMLLLATMVFSVLISELGSVQGMRLRSEQVFVVLLMSIIGFLFVYDLAQLLPKNNIFTNIIEWCGKHSFAIMAFHAVGFRIVNLFRCSGSWSLASTYSFNMPDNVLLYVPLYIISGLAVSYILVSIRDIILGQMDTIKAKINIEK